jgi:hypothetical protein
MGSEELQQEVEELHSISAEGALLANEISEDQTKTTFVRVQAGELAGAADEIAQKVTDARIASGLEQEAAKTIELSGRASEALGELQVSPQDQTAATRAQRKLEVAARETQALVEEL